MKIASLLVNKLYDNFCLDKVFLFNKHVVLSEKIQYLFRKYFTIITGRKEIQYLGHTFTYDNPFTPLLLQGYPQEIGVLDEAIHLKHIHSVLDIGANIGQWAFTLKSLFPHIKILSLEPNPKIFPLLQDNSENFVGWDSYNIGIGKRSHKFLYFLDNQSAEASIYKEKDTRERDTYKKTAVKLISINEVNSKKYKLSQIYDLVKIDVEGAELEVLHAIKGLKFKYLTIEVAIKRERGVRIDDIETFLLKNTKFKPELLYVQTINPRSPEGNATFVLTRK